MIHAETTAPWWKANPGMADVYPEPPEPFFETPAGLAALEGRIWAWEFKKQVKRLLALLATLARFQSWALGEIRRWLHTATATPSVPAFERRRRVCSLGSTYRVRGPPSYCPAGAGC